MNTRSVHLKNNGLQLTTKPTITLVAVKPFPVELIKKTIFELKFTVVVRRFATNVALK